METSITKSVLAEGQDNSYELTLSGTAREIVETLNTLKIPFSELETHLSEDDKRDLINVKHEIDNEKASEEEIEFDLMVRRLVFNSCRRDNVTKIKYLTEANYINTTAELAYEKKGAKGKYEFLKNLLSKFPEYIKYLTEQPYDLQKFLIASDWRNLRYIDDPSDEIVALAKGINPKAALLVNKTKCE